MKIHHKVLRLLCLFLLVLLLSSCLGSVWTAASLVYDRHHVYKKWNDIQLATRARHVLHLHHELGEAGCKIKVATFNGDLLLLGRAPSAKLRADIQQFMVQMGGYRRFFNQIEIRTTQENELQDSLMTLNLRKDIMTDADIDPNVFKIVTSNQVVYLMGDVLANQGARVIRLAQMGYGVKRVVNLMRYYRLE